MCTREDSESTEHNPLERALAELLGLDAEGLVADARAASAVRPGNSSRAAAAAVPTPVQILNDASASFWLKDALRSALRRDAVDAANEACVLARVLERHAARVVAGAGRALGAGPGYRHSGMVGPYMGPRT